MANGFSKAACPRAGCLLIVFLSGFVCASVCSHVCGVKVMGVDRKMRWNTGHRGDGIALQQRQIKAVGGKGINVMGEEN